MQKRHLILSITYLALAVFGGFYTYYLVMLGVVENNFTFSVVDFIQSTWSGNYYAKSITLDLLTTAVAGSVFIVAEGIRLGMKRIWVFILLTLLVAFAFGFPLFLFFRQRQVHKNSIISA
jgi:hypothetical protein